MKKFILILLCASVVASFSACGTSGGAENPSSASKTQEKETLYFGAIETVTGNEIEVSLAHIPEHLKNRETGGEDGEKSGKEGGTDGKGEQAGGVTDIPEGADRSDTASDQVSEEAKSLASTLEYTGEKKSFVLLSGIKLVNSAGGSTNVSDLRKMNVVLITVNAENDTIVSCEILE